MFKKETVSKEFRYFFKENLRKKVIEIEKKRIELRGKVKKARILSIVLFVFSQIIQSFSFFLAFVVAIIAIIVFVSSLIITYGGRGLKIKEKIKNEIIAEIIYFINPNFEYKPNDYIDRDDFIDSCFCSEKEISHYSGDDYISGKINEINFEFSQLNVMREIEFREGNNVCERLFHGLFFIVNLDECIEEDGIVYAIPERMFSSDNEDELEEIKLSSSDFNDYYTFRATNKEFAKHFFSKELMEAMMYCKEDLGLELLVSFKKDKMYVGFDSRQEHFNLDVLKELTEDEVYRFYKDLEKTLNIVENLKLRIRK